MRTWRTTAASAAVLVLAVAAPARAAYEPWDALTADSWVVEDPDDPRIRMYPVNAPPYEVGFDRKRKSGAARGLNALQFEYGGQAEGHLSTADQSGTFFIRNRGDNRLFDDALLLVAIDAPALPPGFALSLGPVGEAPYVFDPAADFGYYDHADYDTGRPSGYYSETSPQSEGLSYEFGRGMVTLLALPGVNLEGTNLGDHNAVELAYAFENLPGDAVFSLYGYDPTYAQPAAWIAHTNRAVPDDNDDGPVSTFKVIAADGGDLPDVPEPATAAALASALAAAAAYLRRRRA